MSTCSVNDSLSKNGSTSGGEGRPATIPERIAANLAAPDAGDFLRLLSLDGGSEALGYAALVRRAARWTVFYRSAGLSAGDRIVVIQRHSADLYASFLGGVLGGFVPAMFAFPSPKFSQAEYFRTIRTLLENADARALVTYPELRDRLATMPGTLPSNVSVCTGADLPDRGLDEAGDDGGLSAMPPLDPDDIAFLQYSSGTTGLKKGVAISHRALLWQVDHYSECIGATPDDRIVSWLPLYHDMGLIACLFLPLITRAGLIAMSPFDWVRRPTMWLRAVSDYGGTLSWLPNFAYNFMANTVRDDELRDVDLSSLRGVVNCSETILADSHERFCARFEPYGLRRDALAVSYAMAENTFAVTSGGFGEPVKADCINGETFARTGRAETCDPSAPRARLMTGSGRALPDTHIEIVDDAGDALPERRVGEIVLRSPCLLSEYHGNREATEAAIRDGRYHTGDLGYLADGELYVTGRKEDLIILSGHNVHPQDIEALVNDVPGIVPGRCVAAGVSDAALGTQSLVVIAETHETDPQRRDAIGQAIRDRIASASDVIVGDVCLVEHMWLRKSTAGKISRTINRDRYLEQVEQRRRATSGGAIETGSTSVTVRRCVERIVAQSRIDWSGRIDPDEPLLGSGLIDSLGLTAVFHAIEDACGVSIPARALAAMGDVVTLRSLAELVERVRSGEVTDVGPESFPRSREDVPMIVGEPRSPQRSTGFWSRYYRWVFWRHGIRVGRGLRVLGRLILRLDGDPRNITIGDDVTLMPYVDLKVRENGKIILHDGVVLDTGVRLVAANDARIELGEDAQLGMCATVNAGEDVIIGRQTSMAGYGMIIASEHKYLGAEPIMQQGYHHAPVYIGEGVWGGWNLFIGPGTRIGNGAVLGVKSVIRGDFPAKSVVMGNPARVIRFRG